MDKQKVVLNGVGKAFIKVVKDGVTNFVSFGTLQDMKLSFTGSSEKIFGGDSLAPIYIINKDQNIAVSFTEAMFDLDYLQLSNGASLDSSGVLVFSVEPTLIASGTSFTVPGSLTGVIPEETVVSISDDATGESNPTYLTYTSGTPTDNQFAITEAGVVTLGKEVTNKYITVNGLYTDSKSTSASVTTASIPSFVMIRHKSMPIERGDGTKVVLHTVIYKARSTGKLDVDYKRQAAATPALEFEVFDSGRTDGVIMRITKEIV